MPTKKIVYTADLQEFRPLIWYGEPLYTRYTLLANVLLELGSDYGEFLCEPLLKGDNIVFLSSTVCGGVAFTNLEPSKQESVRIALQTMLFKVREKATDLEQDVDPARKQLGELLRLAVEVPGLENVIVKDNHIGLVLWGFSSEKARQTDFRLENKISASVADKDYEPVSTPNIANTGKQQDSVRSDVNQVESKLSATSATNSDSTSTTVSTESLDKHLSPPPPPPPPPVNNGEKKKRMPGWFWFILGALLMLLAMLIFWFLFRDKGNTQSSYLPEKPNIIPPIDTTRIITDPEDPAKRKIFSDKVNLALIKGVDMENFAKKLHDLYDGNLEIAYYDTAIKLMQIQTPEGEWKTWRDSLKRLPEVRLAFSNTLFGGSDADPAFNDSKANWYFSEIQTSQAWQTTLGDTSVVVAIVDNGFDLSHPEFEGKIVHPYNIVEGNTAVRPCNGASGSHGTHVAGTAIGLKDNGLGLCGIAPMCKFMPVQIADQDGNMQTIGVVAGILYALHHGADVVNLSLGSYFDENVTSLSESEQREILNSGYDDETDFWSELYDFCYEEDMVLCLAAGNQNILTGIDPFARNNKVLVTSAYAGPKVVKADFSNYGEYSSISAPGVNIYSSVPNSKYGYLQGTSMACPIVAGAAALMKSAHPQMKPQEIIKALIATAKPLQSQRYIGPLLQIADALAYTGDSILNIPDNAKDASFALGKWKSTTDLVNTEDRATVELYFDIKTPTTATVTFQEATGMSFTADMKVYMKDGKLVMEQNGEAISNQTEKTYYKYIYTCQQAENAAECKACSQEQGNQLISFNMIKIN